MQLYKVLRVSKGCKKSFWNSPIKSDLPWSRQFISFLNAYDFIQQPHFSDSTTLGARRWSSRRGWFSSFSRLYRKWSRHWFWSIWMSSWRSSTAVRIQPPVIHCYVMITSSLLNHFPLSLLLGYLNIGVSLRQPVKLLRNCSNR